MPGTRIAPPSTYRNSSRMIVGCRSEMNISCGVRMIRSRLRLVIPLTSRSASLRLSGTGRGAGCWVVSSVILCPCSCRGFAAARAGRVAGEREEDVIERGPPDPQVLKRHATVIEHPPGRDQLAGPALNRHADLVQLRVEPGRGAAEAGDERGGLLQVGPAAHPDLQHIAAKLALELIGRALGRDAAGVQDDDLVGQVLGFLH